MDRIRAHWITLAPTGVAVVAIGQLSAVAPPVALVLALALAGVGLVAAMRARAEAARAAFLVRLAGGAPATMACVVLRADAPGWRRFRAPRRLDDAAVANLGGGRLGVALAHGGGVGGLVAAACRLQATAEAAFGGRTVSLGIASCRLSASGHTTLEVATQALARRSGPSAIELAQGDPEADATARIARAIPDPAASSLFEMWGEPVVCGDTGRLLSVELHPRWSDPALGTLTARDLAPALTADSQWHDLALRTLESGIHLLDSLSARGLAPLPLTLTLPAAIGRCDRFEQRLAFALDRADLHPGALRIRLDPGLDAAEDRGAVAADAHMRPGCPLIHDAAATSVAERIAIPAALTRGIDSDHARRRLVSGILKAAEARGAETVAMGLTRPEEAALMAQFGCTALHGPAIARAMPAPRLAGWIAARAGAAAQGPWVVPADPGALPAAGQARRKHG
ncbi:EAL domain-containing protein [Palleronia rufa]|uniref:EAL domain-containing protein n=1 Tax=Palleronia rufa TaxID=1530186 RepID=UPI00056BFC2A|nr:EAL domain-containing protein [Palleronia rufa]